MARLKEQYVEEVAPALFKKFGYKTTMQIPKIDKVVVNVGCGEARRTPRFWKLSCATWPPSPARRPSSPSPRSPSQTSSCVRVCPSAPRSRCAASVCGSSWIVCSTSLCPVSVTSAASAPTLRRPRQLCPGYQGAAHLPEIEYDKIEQDPRHGYRHLHHRPDRRRSTRAADPGRRSLRTLIRRRTKWLKTSMILKQQAPAKFSTRNTTAARSAAAPTPICVTTACAVSASASWPTRARSPASARLPGNLCPHTSLAAARRTQSTPSPSPRLRTKSLPRWAEGIPLDRTYLKGSGNKGWRKVTGN